jgi:hypothetical protein
VAIFFLLLILIANTLFGELLRLPRLIHHYNEHVIWDNNTSFLDFMAVHYAAEINHPDDEHGDHQRLPLKSVDHSILQVVSIEPYAGFSLSRPPFAYVEKQKALQPRQFHSSAYLDNIWQPPRA